MTDADRYYWYHTIDLGGGLVTPGMYDYRETISSFQFPEDMRGMTVLDVGSATGFFAFEFERRGARVISVELPSLRDLDRFPGQDVEDSLRRIEGMIFPDTLDPAKFVRHGYSERDLYWYLLEGPFRYCRERLGSRIERCYSTVYDLTLERTGVREGFDMVFFGDVLIHTLVSAEGAGLACGALPRHARVRRRASGRPAGTSGNGLYRRLGQGRR